MDNDSRDQKCEARVVKEHLCGAGNGGGSGGSLMMLFKRMKGEEN